MAAWKVLPAVAAGNTVVLKPAEITPLTSVMFAQAAHEAGLPDGVVNVLTGKGRDAGAALLWHPQVAMLSFTGSTAVGRTVLEAATTAKRRRRCGRAVREGHARSDRRPGDRPRAAGLAGAPGQGRRDG